MVKKIGNVTAIIDVYSKQILGSYVSLFRRLLDRLENTSKNSRMSCNENSYIKQTK